MRCVKTAPVWLAGLALVACQPGQDMSSEEAPTPAAAPPAAAPPTPTPPPAQVSTAPQTTNQASLLSEPNWAVLFAGNDLSSFNEVGDAEWNIVDDYVEARDFIQVFLVTKGHYTDFLLQAEFWPSPGANSGIFIRNDNADAINATDGYELNIADTNENVNNRTGSIVNHMAPMATVETDGKWNTYEIMAQGNHIVARVNGTVTADMENDEHPSGPIAFQNNGGTIRFRNIRIRPL